MQYRKEAAQPRRSTGRLAPPVSFISVGRLVDQYNQNLRGLSHAKR
jgi:hypothetical protein